MTEYGKKFELDFKNSCDSINTFAYRIKTRHTQYKGDSEIADFIVYRMPHLFIFELKSTKEKRLPFDMIRANQISGLRDVSEKYGINAGIIVQFRDPYSHWYIPISIIIEYITKGAKSIPLKDVQELDDAVEIKFTQKRVTVKLDVEDLLSNIAKGG